MKGSKQLICIRRRDGQVQRLERFQAEVLVGTGKANFISKTRFKALKAGFEPKKGATDSSVKKAIRAQGTT